MPSLQKNAFNIENDYIQGKKSLVKFDHGWYTTIQTLTVEEKKGRPG